MHKIDGSLCLLEGNNVARREKVIQNDLMDWGSGALLLDQLSEMARQMGSGKAARGVAIQWAQLVTPDLPLNGEARCFFFNQVIDTFCLMCSHAHRRL